MGGRILPAKSVMLKHVNLCSGSRLTLHFIRRRKTQTASIIQKKKKKNGSDERGLHVLTWLTGVACSCFFQKKEIFRCEGVAGVSRSQMSVQPAKVNTHILVSICNLTCYCIYLRVSLSGPSHMALLRCPSSRVFMEGFNRLNSVTDLSPNVSYL